MKRFFELLLQNCLYTYFKKCAYAFGDKIKNRTSVTHGKWNPESVQILNLEKSKVVDGRCVSDPLSNHLNEELR